MSDILWYDAHARATAGISGLPPAPPTCVGSYLAMSDEPDPPCGHRWWASRVEVETLPVLHVCNEPRHNHAAHGVLLDPQGVLGGARSFPVHACSCGAVLLGGDAGPPPPPP